MVHQGAERIARADPVAGAAIGEVDWIESPTWNPDRPGVVTLRYGDSCGCCGSRGVVTTAFPVAEDGVCVPELRIVVDVVAGVVLDIQP
jgi:hypothetical protein